MADEPLEEVVPGVEDPAPPAEEAVVEEEEDDDDEGVEAPAETTSPTVPLAALEDERRKRQDLEAENARLKGSVKPPETASPVKSIEDYYLEDPKGTTEYINGEIARLQNEDPYTNALQVEKLRDLKLELREKVAVRGAEKAEEYARKVSAIIPDMVTAAPILTKFAVEQLGYSMDDLARVTTPQIVGEKAALATLSLIKRQYDLVTGKGPIKRESAAAPPLPVTLGGGEAAGPIDPSKLSDDEWYRQEQKKRLDELKIKYGG